MKKFYCVLATMALAMLVACEPSASNNLATNNGNATTTPVSGPSPVSVGAFRAEPNEKPVVVTISKIVDANYKCVIQVAPQSVTLVKGNDKVVWEVDNDCDEAAVLTIRIEDFRDNQNTTPFGTDPQGACDPNHFKVDPIPKGHGTHVVSRTGKNSGSYKYTIKTSDSKIAKDLDPQVVIN